ncbi:hypothetical protein EVAR_40814_1 [Eumeta japonica]|uniref:Uncharacterized protein n=1 Tax=Eumeta variegata TaxID=151549 RepID=A0A4C1WIC8_EUMVA|nr:hypothetical protein EVAR_40814_1 [Eumeta japonica]
MRRRILLRAPRWAGSPRRPRLAEFNMTRAGAPPPPVSPVNSASGKILRYTFRNFDVAAFVSRTADALRNISPFFDGVTANFRSLHGAIN